MPKKEPSLCSESHNRARHKPLQEGVQGNSYVSEWEVGSAVPFLGRKETEKSWHLGHTLWSIYDKLISAWDQDVPPVTESILYLVIKWSSCLLIMRCPVLT